MDPQEPEDPDRYRYEFPGSPSDYVNRPGGVYRSANGGTILTLGVLSLFCCGIVLGPIAWIMGNMSLSHIYQGEADPCETSSVAAGRALGIIGTLGHAFLLCMIVWGHFFGDQSASYYQYLPYQHLPWDQ